MYRRRKPAPTNPPNVLLTGALYEGLREKELCATTLEPTYDIGVFSATAPSLRIIYCGLIGDGDPSSEAMRSRIEQIAAKQGFSLTIPQ